MSDYTASSQRMLVVVKLRPTICIHGQAYMHLYGWLKCESMSTCFRWKCDQCSLS